MKAKSQPDKQLPRSAELPADAGLLTKPMLARRIGKGVRTVDYWMEHRWIPFIKVGNTVLFDWAEVVAHLKANFGVHAEVLADGHHGER